MSKKIRILILTLCSIVFIVSIVLIIRLLKDKEDTNNLYQEIVENFDVKEQVESETTNFISIDFSELMQKNSDTVGWILYQDINYPFVQTKDNNYYLERAFDKTYNQFGTLFLDYRNKSFDDKNVIIYGHSGSKALMFGSLKQLLDENYFNDENRIIYISTPQVNYNYEIFSVYVVLKEEYYITTEFDTNGFKEFAEIIKNRSYYNFGIDVTEEDKILTLSTCYNDSKRIVVHAKLNEIETRNEINNMP